MRRERQVDNMADSPRLSKKGRHLKLIEAALDLQQAGDQQRALDTLLEAKQEAPDYATIHLLLGITYQALNRWDEAEASLRQALELEPDYAAALQALGLLLSTRKRFEEAIRFLKQHLDHDPGNIVSLKTLVATFFNLGRQEDAVCALQDLWIRTQAEEPGVQYGRLLIQMDCLDQAEQILRQVATQTNKPRTLSELALALVLLDRHEEAAGLLEQATKKDPSFDRAWRGLAQCYVHLERYPEALQAANRALAINDCHYRNWEAKAQVLMSMQKPQEALEAARRGIALIDPKDEEAQPVLHELLLQQVLALLALERSEQALEQLDKARQDFPTEERLAGFQATLLVFWGRHDEALRVLDAARHAGIPDSSNLILLRYQALQGIGRPQEAWSVVEPHVKMAPESWLDTLSQLGVTLYTRGQTDMARAILAQLHQAAPTNPHFMCNLGFVLIGDGELAQAEPLLRRALELAGSENWKPIIAANLGYLYLLERKYPDAESFLDVAAEAEEEAILRVAYWRDGNIVPEYANHPRQFLPTRLAVKANRATLMLAKGQADEAQVIARQLVEETPDASLGHRVLGWVLLAAGKPDQARQAWQQALERSSDALEQQALSGWLGALPQ
jgi:tetratricopeptide (TPR) repeat protein